MGVISKRVRAKKIRSRRIDERSVLVKQQEAIIDATDNMSRQTRPVTSFSTFNRFIICKNPRGSDLTRNIHLNVVAVRDADRSGYGLR